MNTTKQILISAAVAVGTGIIFIICMTLSFVWALTLSGSVVHNQPVRTTGLSMKAKSGLTCLDGRDAIVLNDLSFTC